jgi:hypothetical protein
LVNSYILYKGKEKHLPLYQFKLDIALSLMYGEVLENPGTAEAVKLRADTVDACAANGDPLAGEVVDFIRFDGMNHMPEMVAREGRRCKMEGCKKRSVMWCKKCRVYLCLKRGGRNCFEAFHTCTN